MATTICTALARASTATDMQDLAALQKLVNWLSPGFPTGSFAYSHGLEQAMAEGWLRDADSCHDWIAALLAQGSGRNDAILIAHAWRGEAVEALALALCGASERRRETLEQGAALARILSTVEGPTPPGPYPIVLARAAAAEGADPTVLITLYLQAFAGNLLTACVKSVPLGQTQGQQILARLQPLIRRIAAEAVTAGLDDLGSACLRADLMAIRHETLEPRIYRT